MTKIIFPEEEQIVRWVKHFREVLSNSILTMLLYWNDEINKVTNDADMQMISPKKK